MLMQRLTFVLLLVLALAGILLSWRHVAGFNALDPRWWAWIAEIITTTGGLPDMLLYPVYGGAAAFLFSVTVAAFLLNRARTRNVSGAAAVGDTHGSARWAGWSDVKRAGLIKKTGVTAGGFRRPWGTTRLRHDGPEHVICFAPTRSGKGVGLVLPTLLDWRESVLVLDIKGENYALSAGWRAGIGQRILRFDPAAATGSARYNPLAEVRRGTDHEIADCQNIASMIIDPDGKGLKDFWMQSGWEWLAGAILHVLYRVDRDDGRVATLADVHAFMSVGDDSDSDDMASGDEGFDQLLDDMARFDHGRAGVNAEIRRAAGRMLKRAAPERSGVHSSATVQLALYSDPIVARNTSECDFRIADLMNGEAPTSLYIIIPPSDIGRLRPLIRILMNQFLTRLTADMAFEDGATKKHYRHRLLLMLDEFTAIGKLEIFEKALAFMAGYGLKAFIIVQDLSQLQKEYGREESIISNCHVRIAYAPNKIETAKHLSEMTGKTTIIQRKRSLSRSRGGANVSESTSEVGRALMTPDECMAMPGIRAGFRGRAIPGHMLVFVAGNPPIYGRQWLYFQNGTLKARAAKPPPSSSLAAGPETGPQGKAATDTDVYVTTLNQPQT